LDYVPMPGGEAAVKQPWRMAFGALRAAGFDVGSNEILELLGAQKSEVRVLTQMIERGVNTPLTSSCGRLFDAAAVLVLGRRVVDYEAQAAIELEGVAGEDEVESEPGYATQFIAGNWVAREPARICAGPLWWELMHDLQRGVSTSKISARFHTGVAEGFAKAAIEAGAITGISQVALSGGCLHNRRLARQLRAKLEAAGFEVYQHAQVSPGDGGLSYGQAAVAASMLTKS
jgi:hydrogenase maturation protein HypF